MIYNSPRPFWVDSNVNTIYKNCKFDFSSPSTHVFTLVFFWNYIIFNYFVKYVKKINTKLVSFLYFIVFLWSVGGMIVMFMFGLVYLY